MILLTRENNARPERFEAVFVQEFLKRCVFLHNQNEGGRKTLQMAHARNILSGRKAEWLRDKVPNSYSGGHEIGSRLTLSLIHI